MWTKMIPSWVNYLTVRDHLPVDVCYYHFLIDSSSNDMTATSDDHLWRFDKLGIADCITSHVPLLDCWVRNTMSDHFIGYNEKLYAWLDRTRSIADPNEPPFEPKFSGARLLPCDSDSRATFNKILKVDQKMKPPKENCAVAK